MYVDCSTCGFKSGMFCPVGLDYDRQLRSAVEAEGCSLECVGDDKVVRCPSGHVANCLPSYAYFLSRWIDQLAKSAGPRTTDG